MDRASWPEEGGATPETTGHTADGAGHGKANLDTATDTRQPRVRAPRDRRREEPACFPLMPDSCQNIFLVTSLPASGRAPY